MIFSLGCVNMKLSVDLSPFFLQKRKLFQGAKTFLVVGFFLSNLPRGSHDDDEGLCSLPLFYLFF